MQNQNQNPGKLNSYFQYLPFIHENLVTSTEVMSDLILSFICLLRDHPDKTRRDVLLAKINFICAMFNIDTSRDTSASQLGLDNYFIPIDRLTEITTERNRYALRVEELEREIQELRSQFEEDPTLESRTPIAEDAEPLVLKTPTKNSILRMFSR